MAQRTPPAATVDHRNARALWARQQGLTAPAADSIPATIANTGWLRTLGGVDVYLAARARVPGLRGADLDAAVVTRAVQVIPAVRGCIYLVPAAHVPLAMRVAEEQYRKRNDRELAKLDVPLSEIEALGGAVLAALADGPLAPAALRKALPDGAARSLGAAGKKIGLSSTLPTALRHLEFAGRVERRLEGGRLDSERYRWGLPEVSPFAGASVPSSPSDRLAQLATIFFGHSGPATRKQFAAWAAISQRDAKAAMAASGLVPVAVTGFADDAWVLESDLDALIAGVDVPDHISLLSFEDNYLTLHDGPGAVTDPEHRDQPVQVWGGGARQSTLGAAKHIGARCVVRGDALVGLWEFDLDTQSVVWGTFDPIDDNGAAAVDAAAAEAARFLQHELGHARSFSLDTDKAIRRRAERVHALQ